MDDDSMCRWAPVDHEALALFVLTLERECGHGARNDVPTCAEHMNEHGHLGSKSARATYCDECHDMSYIEVVKIRSLV